jgi:uncharacterized Tic20 family protein
MTTGSDVPDPNQPPTPPGHQPPPPGDQPPPPPPPPPPPVGYQPGEAPMRPDEEKLWAIGAHIGPIVLGFVAPLVVWLVFKDRSRFLDRQGKEALNMQISDLIYFAVAFVTLFLLVGIILLPIVGIAWLVLMVVATIKAANLEDYRYPAIFRFIQ